MGCTAVTRDKLPTLLNNVVALVSPNSLHALLNLLIRHI